MCSEEQAGDQDRRPGMMESQAHGQLDSQTRSQSLESEVRARKTRQEETKLQKSEHWQDALQNPVETLKASFEPGSFHPFVHCLPQVGGLWLTAMPPRPEEETDLKIKGPYF